MESGLALHHFHDTLWSFCPDKEKREADIKKYKPIKEQPLRLRLLQVVPDELVPGREEWQAWQANEQANEQAWRAYEQAKQAYEQDKRASERAWQAEQAYEQTEQAYKQAEQAYLNKYSAELDELHKKLCPDCPWNGKTIFTRRNDKGEWC